MLRFFLTLALVLGFSALLWTQTGPFAWAGRMQLAMFNSYSVKLTMILAIGITVLPIAVAIAVISRRSGSPRPPGAAGQYSRAVSAGALVAALLVLAIGLAPLYAGRPPVPKGPLPDMIAQAGLIPVQTQFPRATEADKVKLKSAVTIEMSHSSSGTSYAPVIMPGSKDVIAVVSGSENDWRNATIRSLPFPDAANQDAVEKSGQAVLSLQPVPIIARRQWEMDGLNVPVILPAFQWGESPLVANIPFIVGGAVVTLIALIDCARPRRRITETGTGGRVIEYHGRPPDM